MSRVVSICLVICFGWALLPPAVIADDNHIDEPEITDVDRDHWAFKPVVRPPVPAVKFVAWAKTEIDRFILAKLEAKSIKPATYASRSTMIRRLYLDLIGIPPTPEQVTAYLNDRRRDAYRRLVDGLLASPDYGQRWGQHWLDLARFAETDGFEHDKVRPQAWQYRDWVISALSSDMPYDQFVRWQLAGDVIQPGNPGAVTATAFCLSGPDMPDINSQDERHHVLLNEITSTVGSVFFSLQVGCAQCHDHKYDALSQADFYRLRAFFDPAISLSKNKSVNVLASSGKEQTSQLMIRGDWRRKGPTVNAAYPRILNRSQQTPTAKEPGRRRLDLADWLTARDHPLTVRVIVNRVWQHHFGRGLSETPSDFGVMGEEPSHPKLLDFLADELIRAGWSLKHLHRQIVLSRVYQMRSTRPTCNTLERRWDFVRDVDPENRLLSRFAGRRLSAETLRDCLFAVSGSLNRDVDGPGVRPPLPPEMIKTLLSGQWKVNEQAADHYRRSIYIFARRNLPYPFLGTFDRPSANASCARRPLSTTPVQALTLFNSEITLDAAIRLAATVSDLNDPTECVNELCFRVFSRRPTSSEAAACLELLADQQASPSDGHER